MSIAISSQYMFWTPIQTPMQYLMGQINNRNPKAFVKGNLHGKSNKYIFF